MKYEDIEIGQMYHIKYEGVKDGKYGPTSDNYDGPGLCVDKYEYRQLVDFLIDEETKLHIVTFSEDVLDKVEE
jgi:hypothetical protein